MAADAFSPVRSGVDDIVEPVGQLPGRRGPLRRRPPAEPEAPGTRSTSCRSQQAAQADTEQRLKQLSALLHLPFVGNLQTVPAEVTNYGTSNFAATIDISVGRDDGVQLNMPVVGDGRPGGPGGPGQPPRRPPCG